MLDVNNHQKLECELHIYTLKTAMLKRSSRLH